MTATVIIVQNIPKDPIRRRGLRPTLSMIIMAGTVTATFMIPTTPVARSAMVPPVRPRDSKMELA